MSVNQSLLSGTNERVALSWRAVGRDERGSASIELGLGITAVLLIGMLSIDLYTLSKADTGSARVAATMADYVSRDRAIDGDEIAALGEYLHEYELGAPASLVFVISAVHQPPNNLSPRILWVDDTLRYGEATATEALVTACKSRGLDGWQKAVLGAGSSSPATLTLPSESVVIVVEVCAELLQKGMLTRTFVADDVYRLHALPVRDHRQRAPDAPTYTPPGTPVVDATDPLGGPPHGSTALAAFARAQVVAHAGAA